MGDSAIETLRRLARGDLAGWSGLPDVGPAEVTAAFGGVVEEPGNGRLSGVPTRFRTYRVPEQREELWGWFDDEDRVRLLVFDWPSLAAPAPALLETLGPPETKLEPGTGHHADAYQWVYAGRGLTLYVREWREDGPEIARVAAYRPTTVDDYVENLGATDRTHYS
jgi:hypothetical protein